MDSLQGGSAARLGRQCKAYKVYVRRKLNQLQPSLTFSRAMRTTLSLAKVGVRIGVFTRRRIRLLLLPMQQINADCGSCSTHVKSVGRFTGAPSARIPDNTEKIAMLTIPGHRINDSNI